MAADPLSVGISPCPNDTFVWHALVHGLVPGPDVQVAYDDIDRLNALAAAGRPDVVKVSCGALPWLLGDYDLLPAGAAVGRGCGPLVLTSRPATAADLRGATVAVPGERTTAYLLLRLWDPGFGRVEAMPFDQIMPAVRDGRVAAGLVIHEARFTFPAYGLHQVADLGVWWESETGLPLPLGAVLARRALAPELLRSVAEGLALSVEYAWRDPAASRSYVLRHAQEMEPGVVDAHIALYVNDYTRDLGDEGVAALQTLLDRAADARLAPRVPSLAAAASG